MLLKTLKGRNFILLVFVPVLIILLWVQSFLNPISLTGTQTQMPLYHLLQSIAGGSNIVLNIFGVILLILMAFGMVRLNERFIFIQQRTDLPAFIFAFLATGTLALKGMHPALMASFLLFLAIERLFGLYHGSTSVAKSFDAGLLVGLASMFYLFAGIYLIWIWLSLAVLGYFRGREILAGLLGFITPLFFVVCWYFWHDGLTDLFINLNKLYSAKNHLQQYSMYQYAFWGVLTVVVVLSSLYMINVYEEKKISSRKYFVVLLIFFLCSVASFLIFRASGIEQYFLSVIPITYLVSHYFELQKHSWMGEVLFAVFIFTGLLIHFLG